MPTFASQHQERARSGHATAPVARTGFGKSLDQGTRTEMQAKFSHDFSQVRVHDGPAAAESAQALGARAFTVGRDVVFAAGEYRPETSAGQQLLAHELAHVVQQSGEPARSGARSATTASAEQEAGAAAARVAAGRSAGPVAQSVPAGTVQRQPADPDQTQQPAQAPPVAPWDPHRRGAFSVTVESAKAMPRTCDGFAFSGGGQFAMSSCGQIEHFCTTPAAYPLQLRAYTDAQNLPRPQPFRGPELRVGLDFVPDGASAPTFSRTVSDPNPRYRGPGHPLEPSFGTDFAISASGSGQLSVNYQIHDAGSNVSVAYIDSIRCHLVPCA